MYFDIHKDKSIDGFKRDNILLKIQKYSNGIDIKNIKQEAINEMTSTKRGQMYKLFCQCIVLTGKIGY
jgi:hypothetical protein